MRLIGKIKQGITKRERNIQPKSKAQGMVEFALILPLLVALLFGVIEFGRMLFVYSVVYTSSREGARYGSAAGDDNPAGVPNYLDCDGIRGATERLAILANVQQIIIAYDEGTDANGNSINRVAGCPNYNIVGGKHRISVEVVADYSTFIPLPSVPSTFQIRSENARTIMSDIEIGVFIAPGMHVGSLIGDSLTSSTDRWEAWVTVRVLNDQGNPLENARVEFSWGSGHQHFGSCNGSYGTCISGPTNSDGESTINIINIRNHQHYRRITVNVEEITHSQLYEYDFTSDITRSIQLCHPEYQHLCEVD
jgi:hypothetical protein